MIVLTVSDGTCVIPYKKNFVAPATFLMHSLENIIYWENFCGCTPSNILLLISLQCRILNMIWIRQNMDKIIHNIILLITYQYALVLKNIYCNVLSSKKTFADKKHIML